MKGFFFMLLGLVFFDLAGQPVFFHHITQQDGLRNGNIRALVKDYQGFVWIGTEDGLHRYDGYSMKIYRNQENDSSSVSSNFIICLFEDSEKNLWVGTLDGGLCMYDRKNDNFRRFNLQMNGPHAPVSKAIRAIHEGSDGYLYVGSNGLFKSKVSADINAMEFRQIPLPVDSSDATEIKVLSIAQSFDKNLFISINVDGLYHYDCTSGKFTLHEISQQDKIFPAIHVDKRRNLLWLASWNNGLLIYDLSTRKHIQIKEGHDGQSLRSNMISSVASDQSGNIWVGTENGLSFIPRDCDPFACRSILTYLPDQFNPTSIQGNTIKVVYNDQQDKLWVGTYYEGLNVYDKNALNFGNVSIAKELLNGPVNTNVNALQVDKSHRLWIGLDGGGLYVYPGKLTDAAQVPMEKVKLCGGADKVKSMKIDDNNDLWIGTWGNGLMVVNTNTRQCRKFEELCPQANIGKEIMSLETDDSGHLWIGTFDRGVFRYTIATRELMKIKNNQASSPNFMDRINALLIDRENNLWVGKIAGGLSYIRKGTNEYVGVRTPHLNSSITVSSLYMDRQGTLWVGAPNQGLIAYTPATGQSRLFGESKGLANNMIYAIAEDSKGRLWLSSNRGISMFEKESGKFTNFNKANGLSTDQFNRNSVAWHTDGNLVFGSIRGLNFFQPDKFVERKEDIQVVFTRLLLNNQEQSVSGEQTVLVENITTTHDLQLKYNQNSFSVEFAALNFSFNDQTVYSYKLEGFDEDWQYAGNRRMVSYTNLEPRKYSLKVRASDFREEWTSPYSELELTIVPVWWQTLWFKIVLAAVIALSIATFQRVRIRYLLVQKKKLEELVENRTRGLNEANVMLNNRIEEINSINALLKKQQNEIIEKNNEIQAQNEELTSQNEHIAQQHSSLLQAESKLKEINVYLERMVDERTEKLQSTIDDLNKTVFELDRFVYSASHDLSAPLKSILGLINIIHLEKNPMKVSEYIDYIRNSVLKLEEVIKSMVDFARNGHAIIESEEFNLHELVKEVISEFAFLPEAARLDYVNLVPDGQPMKSDRYRVKIILHNLIGNSIKYADKNKATRWIRIGCDRTDGYLRLQVTDNGIGIRKEYLDKVFNMYFRATETAKGSGLGLFIVKETLNKIGGTITVRSEFGVQTDFEILIPEG